MVSPYITQSTSDTHGQQEYPLGARYCTMPVFLQKGTVWVIILNTLVIALTTNRAYPMNSLHGGCPRLTPWVSFPSRYTRGWHPKYIYSTSVVPRHGYGNGKLCHTLFNAQDSLGYVR